MPAQYLPIFSDGLFRICVIYAPRTCSHWWTTKKSRRWPITHFGAHHFIVLQATIGRRSLSRTICTSTPAKPGLPTVCRRWQGSENCGNFKKPFTALVTVKKTMPPYYMLLQCIVTVHLGFQNTQLYYEASQIVYYGQPENPL